MKRPSSGSKEELLCCVSYLIEFYHFHFFCFLLIGKFIELLQGKVLFFILLIIISSRILDPEGRYDSHSILLKIYDVIDIFT